VSSLTLTWELLESHGVADLLHLEQLHSQIFQRSRNVDGKELPHLLMSSVLHMYSTVHYSCGMYSTVCSVREGTFVGSRKLVERLGSSAFVIG
jgi:hypothetical protein